MKKQVRASRIPAPGTILARERDARNLSTKELTELLGFPENLVDQIIMEKQDITPDIAKKLANVFGTSEDFWINLQNNFDDHKNKS
jgi:addiction module HigA family antidote